MSDGYFQSGAIVGGHCEIIRPLGIGSMGVVYLCRHLELNGLEMALKVLTLSSLRRSSSTDEVCRTRFRNELTATYRVNNPYVVRTYEYLDEPDCVAYTMEYIAGGDLENLIDSSAPLAFSNVTKLLIQACDGVQAIHRAGIIHRDLKPANILLTRKGNVKITDFGIARFPDLPRLTATGKFLGTFAYLSPQYLQDGIGTVSSDIYALGTIAFEMITGRLPFDETSLYNKVTAKITGDPPAVEELNPECPPALSEVVKKALHREPEQRYQSALEMKTDLELVYKINGYQNAHDELPVQQKEIAIPALKAPKKPSEHGPKAIESIVNPYVEDKLEPQHKNLTKPPKPKTLVEELKHKQQEVEVLTSVLPVRLWRSWTALACAFGLMLIAGIAAPFQDKDAQFVSEDAVAWTNAATEEEPMKTASLNTEVEFADLSVEKSRARLGEPEHSTAEPEESNATVEHKETTSLVHESASEKQPVKEMSPARNKRITDKNSLRKPERTRVVSTAAVRPTKVSLTTAQKKIPSPVTPAKMKRSKPRKVQLASVPKTVSVNTAQVVKEFRPQDTPEIPLPMKVRATLLYRFADYVEWPTGAFSSESAPIELCVLGKDPFGSFLESTASRGRSRAGRPFSVRRFPAMTAEAKLSGCHILYLSKSQSTKAQHLGQALRGKGVLLVTENTGLGIIDFVVHERKVKFAVDTTRARPSGIKIAPLLLDIAVDVRT